MLPCAQQMQHGMRFDQAGWGGAMPPGAMGPGMPVQAGAPGMRPSWPGFKAFGSAAAAGPGECLPARLVKRCDTTLSAAVLSRKYGDAALSCLQQLPMHVLAASDMHLHTCSGI